MKIKTTAREDYLKAILVLQKKYGQVRSVDVARYLGISRPSVCHAVANLSEGGFLVMDDNFILQLTEEGRKIAESIYERHCFFTQHLMEVGIDSATAAEDACRLEHAISEKSFRALKKKLNDQ